MFVGTAGPVIEDGAACSLQFSQNPPDEDLSLAQQAMNGVMGLEPAIVMKPVGEEQHQEALAAMRRFMGGGVG
jgi:hypothetical protein